jgi:outer membrane protein
MKKVVILIAVLFTSGFVFGQTNLKIGWLETADLLAAMPERAKADSDLTKYGKSFQDQIDIMIKEYQTKGQQYQQDKNMTDAMKEVRMKELQDLQNRIESTQQSAQEKIQQKKQDLIQPILDKASKAIQAVAKEKGYDYVFDKSGGTLLVGKEGDDIILLVKAKLGIK